MGCGHGSHRDPRSPTTAKKEAGYLEKPGFEDAVLGE
jgi:hypothetical protein